MREKVVFSRTHGRVAAPVRPSDRLGEAEDVAGARRPDGKREDDIGPTAK
jgi:hypothetical protein